MLANNIDNLKRNCKLTATNYGNLANRLLKRKNIFQIMLPYYSVVGIINAVIPMYFTQISSAKKVVLSFWGLAIAITFLVVSLKISMAHYSERIDRATEMLNKLKAISNDVEADREDILKTPSMIKSYWERYHSVIEKDEIIDKRYFYFTCKGEDKKNPNGNTSEVKSHFSRAEIIYINVVWLLENSLYIFLFVLPFLVYLYVFLILK